MDAPGESVKTINAMEARRAFGRILEEVYYKGDQYIIERAGRPMVAVIPLSQFEALQKIKNQPKPGSDIVKAHTRRSPKRKT